MELRAAAPRAQALGPGAVSALPYVAIVVVGVAAFLPGLGAGFASDDFLILDWQASASFRDALTHFIPTIHSYYRPLSESLVYWLEFHAFGYHPAYYHVFALVCHLSSALLLYRLIDRLGARTAAALVGTAVFVLSIHAHELVFWWGDDHYAVAGPAMLGTILAYVERRTWLSLLLMLLGLLSDEAAITLPAVLAGYEVTFRLDRPVATALRTAAQRLIPSMAGVGSYLLLRLAAGGFWSESHPCHSPGCDALGIVEYFDRLFLRPGRVIELLRPVDASRRLVIAGTLLALLVVIALLMNAWRWRNWRLIGFGATWCIVSIGLFVYGLWPYVSDRFLYFPELGLAVAVAGGIDQSLHRWRLVGGGERLAIAGALTGLTLWVFAGVPTIWHRASQWNEAARTVSLIFDRTQRLDPDPPPGAVMVFLTVPDSLTPDIPPGNTGPYVLRNGLTPGLRLRYGRSDISPIPATFPIPAGARSVVCRQITSNDVVAVECPRWLTSERH